MGYKSTPEEARKYRSPCPDPAPSRSTISGKCHRAQQCIFCLARVQSGVMHDNRRVGFDHARKIRIARNRFRILKIIETQMSCPTRRDGESIGSNRLAICIKDRDMHPHIAVRYVQQADGLMAGHVWCGTRTRSRNISFRDSPAFATERFHLLHIPQQLLLNHSVQSQCHFVLLSTLDDS